MLIVYDGSGSVCVRIEGPWLHPVVWLFSEDAADVRACLRNDRRASVFDTVVGTAALSCYRLLGVTRITADLSDSGAMNLADTWNMLLSAERVVNAIDCASEGDVTRIASENGGVPDPEAVLAMLRRRATAKPQDVRVHRFENISLKKSGETIWTL
ncbi:MAG: hypothetical protein ACLFM0_11050 [Spirochaetales bacterium]